MVVAEGDGVVLHFRGREELEHFVVLAAEF